jgi:hypothetical protein
MDRYQVDDSRPLCRLTVSGWSMVPVLLPGDTVQFELWPETACIGDILIFFACGDGRIHRVISVVHWSDATYVTKGDNAPCFDIPVHRSSLLGKVVSLRDGNGLMVDLRVQSPWRVYRTVQFSKLLAHIGRLCHNVWRRMSRSLHIALPEYPFYKLGEFLSVPVRLALCMLAPTPLWKRSFGHFARALRKSLSSGSPLEEVCFTLRQEEMAGRASRRGVQ